MATYNKNITTWIPTYTDGGVGTTTFTVSDYVTDFDGLTQVEADDETGDIAEFLYAMLNSMADTMYTLDPKPAQWSLTRSTSVNETTGVSTKQFVVRFNVTTGTASVVDES